MLLFFIRLISMRQLRETSGTLGSRLALTVEEERSAMLVIVLSHTGPVQMLIVSGDVGV